MHHFKYGERLFSIRYGIFRSNHTYRFRMDPVPNTSKRRPGKRWMRNRMRTFNEKKHSYAIDSKYIRSKRLASSLPDTWDDRKVNRGTGWKDYYKTKKQWMRKLR